MDYERIHKIQMGVISPSKLRMKLLGVQNSRRKEGGSNSSRASPSKLEDLKNAKNSLLSVDLDEEAHQTGNNSNKGQNTNGASYLIHPSGNLSTVHPVRSQEEDGNGYDSGYDNGSTSSFEFHQGERTSQHPTIGPFFRHVPSKWNDAEKWIVNRQTINQNVMKKTSHNQGNRQMNSNWVKIAPESMIADQNYSVIQAADTKRIDSANLNSQNVVEKFSFDPCCFQANSVSANRTRVVPRLQEEQNHKEVSVSEAPIAETTVSMRNVGTEMTPIPSQEPSRTGTPIEATTPSRSPKSSMPSTPKIGAPATSPIDATTDDETVCRKKGCRTELSERELQMKTRREIAALGIQLGKMNIASWASKNEVEPATSSLKTQDVDQLVKTEYEARAAAWEEAQKSKHMARYKREEIKIQAWESRQKAKIETQMREMEVEAERMIARAQEKMVEKLAVTRQQVEEKQAAAEARRNQQAARTAQQVEQICETGRVPSSHFRCCSWFL